MWWEQLFENDPLWSNHFHVFLLEECHGVFMFLPYTQLVTFYFQFLLLLEFDGNKMIVYPLKHWKTLQLIYLPGVIRSLLALWPFHWYGTHDVEWLFPLNPNHRIMCSYTFCIWSEHTKKCDFISGHFHRFNFFSWFFIVVFPPLGHLLQKLLTQKELRKSQRCWLCFNKNSSYMSYWQLTLPRWNCCFRLRYVKQAACFNCCTPHWELIGL